MGQRSAKTGEPAEEVSIVKSMFRFALTLTALAVLIGGSAATAVAAPRPSSYALTGDAVFPEGIAFDQRTGNFYVSSTTDGSIQRGNVQAPTATVFIAGGGSSHPAIGVELDDGHLAVAGGPSGEIRTYDAATGAPIRVFTTGSGGFLNDLVATRNGDLFVTDSFRPILWRVAAADIVPGAPIAAEPWLDFTGSVLGYEAGFNLNGIVATPNGKYLIVVQTNTGELFRISVATKDIVQIDISGGSVDGPSVNGDGLELRGGTLFAVASGQIAKVNLSGQLTSGVVVSRTTDPSFSSPTTIAIARGRLLVVNSQFAARNAGTPPTLPFKISSIAIP
jgi:Cu-Zn family superoxide dismutase